MNMASATRAVIDRKATDSMIDQVFVSGLNFIVGIVAARLLGVADFGTFTLILMISSVTSTVQSHLLCTPMMTLAGLRAARAPGYFAGIWRLGAAVSAASGLAVALAMGGIFFLRGDPVDAGLLAAGAFATLAQNQQIVLRRIRFAEHQGRSAVMMDVIRFAAMLAVGGAFALLGVEFDAASVLWLLGLSALAAVLPAGLRLSATRTRQRMVRATIRRHWPLSRWMLLLFAVSVGQEQIIWIVTGIQLGDEAVGGLRAGQYLLGASHFILHAMENFVPNRAAEHLRLGGRPALTQYLVHQTLVLGGAMLALILVLGVFATLAVRVVFGEDYVRFAAITGIMAVAYGATVIRSIWVHYLRAIENARSIFLAHLASSVTGVVLIAPMIGAMGLAGAAWTIAISQLVCLAATVIAVALSAREEARSFRALTESLS